MYRMTDEEFETAIAEALDAMPEQFMEALQQRGRRMGRGAERLSLGLRRDGRRKTRDRSPAADAAESDCEEESGEDEARRSS